MKRYYLAYGSNLNLIQMQNRCKDAKFIGDFILNDYCLVYKGSASNYAYLTIEKSIGDYVPVVLFQISKNDEKSLDNYEAYPVLYEKQYVFINIGKKIVKALIYVMNAKLDYNIPSLSYVDCCKIGYFLFGFDPLLLDRALEKTKNKIKQKKL